MTREHFKSLYGNQNVTLYRYEGSKLNLVKTFALGKDIEIMVMTVDSFNKKANTIFKKTDTLMGELYPYQYIQQTRPILILDESQNYQSERAQAALRTLKPLFAINYSATPGRDAPNMVYKLTPFDAFQRNLVKKIEVLGMVEAQSTSLTVDYLHLNAIEKRGSNIIARFNVMLNNGGTLEEQEIEVTGRTDLQAKTHNEAYAGWKVEEINLKEEFVSFKNGERINLSEERLVSLSRESLFRKQIEETIKTHISKQAHLRPYGIKVLSLFFIDRVDNYEDDEGIIKRLFDESFNRLKKKDSYFSGYKASDVREGYFAKKKAGKKEEESFVDTPIEEEAKKEADREAEKAAYELIMKDKERLLSFEETPVSFIFAHSALREGWDNPNVFQICALREISSEKQRRQTIGRGLRLPVTQSGERMVDRHLNILTVIANESYSGYVERLQREYAETGDLLPEKPANASEKDTAERNASIFKSKDFVNFWNKLILKTDYQIKIDTDKFIQSAVEKINTTQFPEAHIVITKGSYVITNYALELKEMTDSEAKIKITRSDTLGQEENTIHFYKINDDLSKITGNPVLKGFKIVHLINEGTSSKVIFSEVGQLSFDRSILFSTEQGQSFSTQRVSEKIVNLPKFNLIERTSKELSITRSTVFEIFKRLNASVKQSLIKILKVLLGFLSLP
jgi:type III restriction enzyme